MPNVYSARFSIQGTVGESERVEIRNPAGSGKLVRVLALRMAGERNATMWGLRRYGSLPTYGAGGDAPVQQTVYRNDAASHAPVVEVRVGSTNASFVWPSASSATFAHVEQLLVGDAGDDREFMLVGRQNAAYAPILRPGEAMSVVVPDGETPYAAQLLVEEQSILPVAHLSQTLPDSGAFTTGSYFSIPAEWTGLTFLVAYTAANPSSNARPRWRVSWSDGLSDYPQPIAETTLDVSGAPAANRDVYSMVERYPSAVTQGATVRFLVPIARPPGLASVRLDIAELGDTARPGSVVVTVAGA